MRRYENKGMVIEVPLDQYKHKGYYAFCRYKHVENTDNYELAIWLKNNDVENTMYRVVMNKAYEQLISGTRETIRKNIVRIVEYMCSNNVFDKYVADFEDIIACYYKGTVEN